MRRYVRPQLTHDAGCVLKACYLRLRAESARAGDDAVPVTTRTLEALVRLAEARAKLEGREQVTASDAYDVVDMYEQTLPSAVAAPDAFDPAAAGLPSTFQDIGQNSAKRRKTSLNKQLRAFADGLRAFATRCGRRQFTTDELRALAEEASYDAMLTDFGNALEALNARGEILKVRNDETRMLEWKI